MRFFTIFGLSGSSRAPGGTSKRGTSVNVALAALHDFFWDHKAIEAEIDDIEWADGIEGGVPFKWV